MMKLRQSAASRGQAFSRRCEQQGPCHGEILKNKGFSTPDEGRFPAITAVAAKSSDREPMPEAVGKGVF
jgi:hypothetical protein